MIASLRLVHRVSTCGGRTAAVITSFLLRVLRVTLFRLLWYVVNELTPSLVVRGFRFGKPQMTYFLGDLTGTTSFGCSITRRTPSLRRVEYEGRPVKGVRTWSSTFNPISLIVWFKVPPCVGSVSGRACLFEPMYFHGDIDRIR